jgi:hypothetical protein
MFAESRTAIVLTDWRMKFTRFRDFKEPAAADCGRSLTTIVVDRFARLSWNISANAR